MAIYAHDLEHDSDLCGANAEFVEVQVEDRTLAISCGSAGIKQI